jgi:hypothetical protein
MGEAARVGAVMGDDTAQPSMLRTQGRFLLRTVLRFGARPLEGLVVLLRRGWVVAIGRHGGLNAAKNTDLPSRTGFNRVSLWAMSQNLMHSLALCLPDRFQENKASF